MNKLKGAILPILGALTLITLAGASGINIYETSLRSTGSISYSKTVEPFGLRIADMMADLLQPYFDDAWYPVYWKEALDDLATASPNGEITHVQMRIWWTLSDGLINPVLGSKDGGPQTRIMENDNWKRWYFGYIAPGQQSLLYGPSAIERIHAKGFKFELSISGAWENGDVVKPGKTATDNGPCWWAAKEANFPAWVAAGGGEKFLDNYKNNVVLPVANFIKYYLQDGDIFDISFEMNYPTSDFTWSHNEKWNEIINQTRQVFRDAGKNIFITLDHCGWYDDFGLGYKAVKLQNPNATLTSDNQGISGATYLNNLDFISYSHWIPLISSKEVPATWTDNDISWLTNRWFDNKQFDKVGTGYKGVPGIKGRDFIADIRALSQIMGKKVLMNTGYFSRHGKIAEDYWNIQPITADNMEQRVAWSALLRAIRDPRSNYQVWCAGQDFERYCRDKAAQPDFIDSSWRKSVAQQAIINEIDTITNPS